MKFLTLEMVSKWGFEDGCILKEWMQERGIRGLQSEHVLREVARMFLLPRLEVPATLGWGSGHNPAILETIDGREITNPDDLWVKLAIKPHEIEVTDDEIWEAVEVVYKHQNERRNATLEDIASINLHDLPLKCLQAIYGEMRDELRWAEAAEDLAIGQIPYLGERA